MEARRKIENEMEKFREHEKEFKLNKLNPKALANLDETSGKFMFEDDDSGSYGEMDGDYDVSGGSDDDGLESEGSSDKQWLAVFLSDLKKLQVGVETELTDIKNQKKTRKSNNKDKIGALTKKMEGWKKLRERTEELTISMDYLEQGSLRELKARAKLFLGAPDEEDMRLPVVEEVESLIEASEQNRRKQTSPLLVQTDVKLDKSTDSLEMINASDVLAHKIASIESLNVGHIFDGQDYLGNWHLTIVIEEPDTTHREVHFIPFQKANRNETFSQDDLARVAPAFTRT